MSIKIDLIDMSTQISQNYTFLPTQISGCQLWFDGADSTTFTLSGSNISQWRDKSSNAYSVAQATGANQPIFTSGAQNGLSGIQFATSTFLFTESSNIPNFSVGPATSVFVAARNASTNSGWNLVNTIWFDGTGTTRYHFSFNFSSTPGTTLYINNGSVGQVTSNATPALSNAILGFTASSTSATIHTNGSSNAYGGVTLPNANNSTKFIFGDNRNTSTFGSNIMIFEMIGFNIQVSTTQRQQIEGYLAWKWGLQASLPGNHPYRRYPPFMNSLPLPYTPTVQIPTQNTAVFQPTQISGCRLWLDAADLTSLTIIGNVVTQWRDKSGINASPTTIGGSPLYNPGLRAITLNGSNTYFLGPFVNTTDKLTGIVVCRLGTQTGGYFRLLSAGSSSANDYNNASYAAVILHSPDSAQIGGFRNSATNFTTVPIASQFIFINQWNGANFTSYVNGSTGATTNNTGNFNTSSYSIGRDVGNTDGSPPNYSYAYWPGNICEVILYNSSPTTSERQQLEGYLAWKWELQGNLPATHPYKNSPYPGVPAAPVPAAPPQIKSGIWSPTQFSSCSLWLDATDSSTITLTAGRVTRWNDKVTNGTQFATQSTWTSPTLGTINKLQALRYSASSGSGMTLNMNSFAPVFTGYSYFSVFFGTTSSTGNTRIWQATDGNRLLYMAGGFTSSNNVIFFGGLSSSSSTLTASPNVVNIVSIIENNVSSQIFLNGSQTGSTGTVDASSISAMTLGIGVLGADKLDGFICEYVFFNTNLSTAQRQQVEGYLAWKWGIQTSLPATHPYRYIPPSP